MNKLKILVSCYACSPVKGSEPGMGWKFIIELSKFHKLWIITEKSKFENDIIKELKSKPELFKNIHFIFIEKVRHRLLRIIWPPSYYWFYKQWQKKAYIIAEKLHSDIKFDLAHQLNMVGYREPGYLWKLDIPFVWGPVGGLENMQWNLFRALDFRGKVHFFGRNIMNILQLNFMQRPRQAAQKASFGLLPATSNSQKLGEKYWKISGNILCEVGPPLKTENIRFQKRIHDETLKIAWSGLHEPRKALNLLLNSLAQLPETMNWHLDVLGDGDCNRRWRKLSIKLGIESKCTWHGWLKLNSAQNIMAHAHLYVISSLHDLTSTVLLEALTMGLPIICLDHCGFTNVVNEQCGIKISTHIPYNEILNSFADAIIKIYNDEQYRYQLAINAIKRAQDFSWDKKIILLNNIYQKKMAIKK